MSIDAAIGFILIGFIVGMIVGLIFGPDSEREHAAKVDGWLDGYAMGRKVDPQIADLVGAIARGETESQREGRQ